MGAQQSSTGATGGGEAEGVHVKTSYYELLGVERSATDDEIKKAYRRKALELHPDRNYGDADRTTALFAEVQSAYEVLSDPQERSWYDAHEGDILRGGAGGDAAAGEHYEYNMRVTTADDIAAMMGKFRTNIDFSDSPNGFYGFVREAFEQLAKEEEHAASYEDVRIPDYPSFGHKNDGHEDVVREFYAVWNGFATVKTFAWMDVYRTSDATDRRMRRAMEKENKKFREEGIRAFNDAVRTLVAFVRKRDPRYRPNTQSPEAAAKAQREVNKARAAKLRAEKAALMEEDAVPEWAKARDPEELIEEEESDVEEDIFECVACHKTFKSERQYDAHEKSKKHQKAVYALKKKMQKDNAHLNLDEDLGSSGIITPMEEEDVPVDEDVVPIKDDEPIDEDIEQIANQVDDINLAEKSSPPSEPDSDSDSDSDYASRSDIEARLQSFRKDPSAPDIHNSSPPSPFPTQPKPDDPESDHNVDAPDNNVPLPPKEKKLGAAAKKRAKRAAKQDQADSEDAKHKCQNCDARFPSKTQLFQHLKDFGHAALKNVEGGGRKGKRK